MFAEKGERLYEIKVAARSGFGEGRKLFLSASSREC